MINQARFSIARRGIRTETTHAVTQPSAHMHGLGGALFGATSFGAAFPIVLAAAGASASGAETPVLVACGALFGIMTGGTMGYSIGHRGR